jgi:hypothetical protein
MPRLAQKESEGVGPVSVATAGGLAVSVEMVRKEKMWKVSGEAAADA